MKNAKFLLWKMHFWAKNRQILPKFWKINCRKCAKFWRLRSREECKSCRSRKMLQNASLLAIVAVDTEENEPIKNEVWWVRRHFWGARSPYSAATCPSAHYSLCSNPTLRPTLQVQTSLFYVFSIFWYPSLYIGGAYFLYFCTQNDWTISLLTL